MGYKESDLFKPLQEHLQCHGMKVYTEIPSMGHTIDVIAQDSSGIQIAYELKRYLSNKVIQQAIYAKQVTGHAYAVVGSSPRQSGIEKAVNMGIGVMRVELIGKGWHIEVLANSVRTKPLKPLSLENMVEGEEAGHPVRKGVGPGIFCLEHVKEYLAKNPKANWRELWANVHNHYANPQSMAQSLAKWQGFSLSKFKKELSNA